MWTRIQTRQYIHIIKHLLNKAGFIFLIYLSYHVTWKFTEKKLVYLDENCAISVGVGVDSPSGSLTANVAGKGNAHPPTWRFREKGPREGRYLLSTTGSLLRSDWARRTFHTRPRRPPFHRRRTQNQSHRRILQIHPKNSTEIWNAKNPPPQEKNKKSIPWRAWVCCRAERCLIHWGRIGNPNCFHYLIRSRRQPPCKTKVEILRKGLEGLLCAEVPYFLKMMVTEGTAESRFSLGRRLRAKKQKMEGRLQGNLWFPWKSMATEAFAVTGFRFVIVFLDLSETETQSLPRPQNLHHISSYTHARRLIR